MQLSSLQNGSDIRGVAMGPQANLTAKEVDTLSRAFALWLAGRTQRPPHSRWDGRSAFRPRLERGLYCRVSGLRAFCPRLRDGQHARYVYDNRVRSNTLRRRRDADRQPSAQRS